MQCVNCGSGNVKSFVNEELRELHLLCWICFDCKEDFLTGETIDKPLDLDAVEYLKKYRDEFMAQIESNDSENNDNKGNSNGETCSEEVDTNDTSPTDLIDKVTRK